MVRPCPYATRGRNGLTHLNRTRYAYIQGRNGQSSLVRLGTNGHGGGTNVPTISPHTRAYRTWLHDATVEHIFEKAFDRTMSVSF